jgi:hypothetical protein
MQHKSQALMEEYQMSKRRARGRVGAGGDELEEGEEFGTTEDLEAAREDREEKESDDEADLREFMKKHSKKASSSSSSGSGKGKKAGEAKSATTKKKK